jgi:cytochrome c oxidase cbb3-type subunit I/II
MYWMRLVGGTIYLVPYSVEQVQRAPAAAKKQAETIVKDLAEQGITVAVDSEMVAIIAYLQSLGLPPEQEAAPASPSQVNASGLR